MSSHDNVILEVRPEVSGMPWIDFVQKSPPFSIAIDGYVYGRPEFSFGGPRANFNHHEDVDRLATRSTCAQVLMAVRMGLFDRFRDEFGARAVVHVNDCDQDVCTSWALLSRPDLCGPNNPSINRLVALEDMLDATAGMYPFHRDAPLLRELAWVYEPYSAFRASGLIDLRRPREFRSVITDVVNRIHQHLYGRGEEVPVDTRYERIGGGTGWTAVRELGGQARIGMFSDGIRAFVSVRERGNGRYSYTIGRSSIYIPPNLYSLERLLNEDEFTAEPDRSTKDLWGGGGENGTIMGSPRAGGSILTPEAVFRRMEEACACTP